MNLLTVQCIIHLNLAVKFCGRTIFEWNLSTANIIQDKYKTKVVLITDSILHYKHRNTHSLFNFRPLNQEFWKISTSNLFCIPHQINKNLCFLCLGMCVCMYYWIQNHLSVNLLGILRSISCNISSLLYFCFMHRKKQTFCLDILAISQCRRAAANLHRRKNLFIQ